jgi:hypothetical protein
MLRRLAFAVVFLLAGTLTRGQETRVQYLSGHGIDDATPWEFYCSSGDRSGEWTTIKVPWCWDVAGFGKLTYGRLPKGEKQSNEQGKYRFKFNVPADWNGQTIELVFEGVMTDAQVWVNGQSAGAKHQGAYYRFKYDVTKLVKIGGENLLEVTVDKESANASINNAERRGDYWNYGGIFRPVYLQVVPKTHIERVAIDARGDGKFSADVVVAGNAESVRAQIVSAKGEAVGEAFSAPVANGLAKLSSSVASPRLWTAETPNLYFVDLTVMRGEKALHHVRQRFGFRTIEVRAGEGVFVNGKRAWFKGCDRHSFWPESGRATSEKISRGDIALMKEMNMNAVRMSHYPPDVHFLEACDEMGMYVLDELAGWHQAYDTPTAQGLVRDMVERDVNHPSILFWDNGNEGGWNKEVDDDFAKWDPQQRHVLHPWAPFRGINTKHYPTYEQMVKLAQGPDVYFPTEFQHALFDGGGGCGLEDYWEVMLGGKASAGGFIWAFLDESVKRTDGTMDGQGNQAPDGIVGPYREREGSFYTIKEVWSPVVVTQVSERKFRVENRYDFLNAKECAFRWELRRLPTANEGKAGYTVVAEGKIPSPDIAPHESAEISVEIPPRADADGLALRVDSPDGKELWTWVWPIERAHLTAKSKGSVAIGEDAEAIHTSAGGQSFVFSKKSARLTDVSIGGRAFPLVNGPRPAFGEAELVGIEHHANGDDQVIKATFHGNLSDISWRVHPDGSLDLDYEYSLAGQFDYFGVSFDLAEESVKSMKWLGNGPYRAWKNRLPGGTLSVWENAYNNTMTGYSGWIYPEFKGYYAGVRWMEIRTTAGNILVEMEEPMFVQMLRPEFPGHPKPHSATTAATQAVKQSASLSANAWANFPDAGFSLLRGIAPMGTKFNVAQQLGPKSQQNVAQGTYRGKARFVFGD